MKPFSLTQPKDADAAIQAHAKLPDAQFIGGGTNLLDLMKYGVMEPKSLVDLQDLSFHEIGPGSDGGLRLGAGVTNAETAEHPKVKKDYPLLSQAILSGASPQLRNMATNGGNLLQRTRCYYFYDCATACNKRRPGSGCAALKGFNRIHAILGASEHCIATHPSDMCVALVALDAVVKVRGPEGEREIAVEEFHRLPGENPEKDTVLKESELILSIELPSSNFSKHSHYLKVRDRESYAFALVSVAAALQLSGGRIIDSRVALGGVAHKPWRARAAEDFLKDKECDRDLFLQAGKLVVKDARGYGHNDFKLELAPRAVAEALLQAWKGQES
ncbi:MAG TPA: xanthine dehydrogenase family protein subunit M [Phycisphaerales bacterium]|nr:xanthine dehydrogenase family protein subunit M [Phycisphaerales bacterium]